MSDKFLMENAQLLLDEGNSPTKTAEILNVHHSKICRLISSGLLEIYNAYDEWSDRAHLYQNFEWLWEEDYVESICEKAFNAPVILNENKDADYFAVGRYVLEKYGGIKQYLISKSLNHLSTEISVRCLKCESEYNLDNWYREAGSLWGINTLCKKCRDNINNKYFTNNPQVVFANNSKRREATRGEDFILSKEEYITLRKVFNWTCALSNEDKNITIDHFIPVSWKFFTHHKENFIPLMRSFNSQKNNRHPLQWAEEFGVDTYKMGKVIEYLSHQNRLMIIEYKEFIDWCYQHKGEYYVESKYPIEIWRESVGKQFPLPSYAMNEIGSRLSDEINEINNGSEAIS